MEMEELEDRFTKAMDVAMDAQRVRILSGHFPTMEKYQRECGFLEGLSRARDVFVESAHPMKDLYVEAEL